MFVSRRHKSDQLIRPLLHAVVGVALAVFGFGAPVASAREASAGLRFESACAHCAANGVSSCHGRGGGCCGAGSGGRDVAERQSHHGAALDPGEADPASGGDDSPCECPTPHPAHVFEFQTCHLAAHSAAGPLFRFDSASVRIEHGLHTPNDALMPQASPRGPPILSL